MNERQLSLFSNRCEMLAERVAAGRLRLIDAVDLLQSAAELSGLIESVGDNAVQAVLAAAFVGTPRSAAYIAVDVLDGVPATIEPLGERKS